MNFFYRKTWLGGLLAVFLIFSMGEAALSYYLPEGDYLVVNSQAAGSFGGYLVDGSIIRLIIYDVVNGKNQYVVQHNPPYGFFFTYSPSKLAWKTNFPGNFYFDDPSGLIGPGGLVAVPFSGSSGYDVVLSFTGEGTVSGSGNYQEGDTVFIQAIPAEGWLFNGWTGSISVPQAASTSFTMPAEDVELTANFVLASSGGIVTIEYPPGSGTATGAGFKQTGSTVEYSFTPSPGWRFYGWTSTITLPSGNAQSGSFIMPEFDVTLTALVLNEDEIATARVEIANFDGMQAHTVSIVSSFRGVLVSSLSLSPYSQAAGASSLVFTDEFFQGGETIEIWMDGELVKTHQFSVELPSDFNYENFFAARVEELEEPEEPTPFSINDPSFSPIPSPSPSPTPSPTPFPSPSPTPTPTPEPTPEPQVNLPPPWTPPPTGGNTGDPAMSNMSKSDFYDAVRSATSAAFTEEVIEAAQLADLETDDGSALTDTATGLVASFYDLGESLRNLADAGFALATSLYPHFPALGQNPRYSFTLPILGTISIDWASLPGYSLLRWLMVFVIWVLGVIAALKIIRSGVA